MVISARCGAAEDEEPPALEDIAELKGAVEGLCVVAACEELALNSLSPSPRALHEQVCGRENWNLADLAG